MIALSSGAAFLVLFGTSREDEERWRDEEPDLVLLSLNGDGIAELSLRWKELFKVEIVASS